MNRHLNSFSRIVGDSGVVADVHKANPYTTELRSRYRSECMAVLLPASTTEVAAIVRYCRDQRIGIVPQGGNTGTVGGSVATVDQVIVNLERMQEILEVDLDNETITVQAGCILSDIQQCASSHGRFFPLSLGAEHSCRIGGNLATNAGGVNVLHYGNARDLVLGLEAVLADGELFNGLKKLRKDNAGYDLRHLLIGSEGTLGIITAATLKLFPAPASRVVGLAGLQRVEDAVELMGRLRDGGGGQLTTMELMSATTVAFAVTHAGGRHWPFERRCPWYVLLVMNGAHSQEALRQQVEDSLARAFDDELVVDAIIATSEKQAADLAALREEIVAVQKLEGGSIKHDISVPVSAVATFIDEADRVVTTMLPGARPYAFGHLGDGNIHYNVSQPVNMDVEEFYGWGERIQDRVLDIVHSLGGSVSAEHGIGLARKAALEKYQDPVAMSVYRRIKHAMDPDNLFNPGKMLD